MRESGWAKSIVPLLARSPTMKHCLWGVYWSFLCGYSVGKFVFHNLPIPCSESMVCVCVCVWEGRGDVVRITLNVCASSFSHTALKDGWTQYSGSQYVDYLRCWNVSWSSSQKKCLQNADQEISLSQVILIAAIRPLPHSDVTATQWKDSTLLNDGPAFSRKVAFLCLHACTCGRMCLIDFCDTLSPWCLLAAARWRASGDIFLFGKSSCHFLQCLLLLSEFWCPWSMLMRHTWNHLPVVAPHGCTWVWLPKRMYCLAIQPTWIIFIVNSFYATISKFLCILMPRCVLVTCQILNVRYTNNCHCYKLYHDKQVCCSLK